MEIYNIQLIKTPVTSSKEIQPLYSELRKEQFTYFLEYSTGESILLQNSPIFTIYTTKDDTLCDFMKNSIQNILGRTFECKKIEYQETKTSMYVLQDSSIKTYKLTSNPHRKLWTITNPVPLSKNTSTKSYTLELQPTIIWKYEKEPRKKEVEKVKKNSLFTKLQKRATAPAEVPKKIDGLSNTERNTYAELYKKEKKNRTPKEKKEFTNYEKKIKQAKDNTRDKQISQVRNVILKGIKALQFTNKELDYLPCVPYNVSSVTKTIDHLSKQLHLREKQSIKKYETLFDHKEKYENNKQGIENSIKKLQKKEQSRGLSIDEQFELEQHLEDKTKYEGEQKVHEDLHQRKKNIERYKELQKKPRNQLLIGEETELEELETKEQAGELYISDHENTIYKRLQKKEQNGERLTLPIDQEIQKHQENYETLREDKQRFIERQTIPGSSGQSGNNNKKSEYLPVIPKSQPGLSGKPLNLQSQLGNIFHPNAQDLQNITKNIFILTPDNLKQRLQQIFGLTKTFITTKGGAIKSKKNTKSKNISKKSKRFLQSKNKEYNKTIFYNPTYNRIMNENMYYEIDTIIDEADLYQYENMSVRDAFLTIMFLESILSSMNRIVYRSRKYNTRNIDFVFCNSRISKIEDILRNVRNMNT